MAKARRSLRVLRWIGAGLIALLAVTAVALALFDWNRLKGRIEGEITAATGREAQIRGEVSLDWGFPLRFRFEDVRLANAAWSEHEDMLTADALSVGLSVPALLTGEVQVTSIEARGPELLIERAPSGRTNLQFEGTEDRSSQGEGPAELPFQQISLEDARVRYLDHAAERDLRASFDTARLEKTATGLRAQAQGRVADEPVTLQATGGTLGELLGKAGFPVDVRVRSRDLEAQLEGEVAVGGAAQPMRLRFEVSGEDVSRLGELLGRDLQGALSYRAAGMLVRQGQSWSVRDLDLRLGESRLSGRATLGPEAPAGAESGTPLRQVAADGGMLPARPWNVDLQLRSETLNLSQLAGIFPEKEQEDAPGFPLALLGKGNGTASLQVERLITPALTLHDVQADARLSGKKLYVDLRQLGLPGGRVAGHAVIDASAPQPVLQTRLHTASPLAMTALARAFGAEVELGKLQAVVQAQLHSRDGRLPTDPEGILAGLRIQPSTVAYQHLDEHTQIAGVLRTPSPGGNLLIRAQGNLEEVPPATATLRGGPLPGLLKPETYSIHLTVDSAASGGEIDTTLGALLAPDAFRGRVELQGRDPAYLEPWLAPFTGAVDLPSLPAYHVQGLLTSTDETWKVSDLNALVGNSELRGSLSVDTAGGQPHLEAEIDARVLDLAQLTAALGGEEPTAPAGPPTPQETAQALRPLQRFSGRASLHAGRLVLPDGTTLRDLGVRAVLEDGRLEAAVPRAGIGGGTAQAELVIDTASRPTQGSLDARLDSVRLGQVVDWFTRVDEHLGQVSGELHVDITATPPSKRRDVLFPGVGRVVIRDTRFKAHDPKTDTEFTLTLRSEGVQDEGERQLRAQASGTYRGLPMSLEFTGDPLLALRDPDAPYNLELDLQAVSNRIQLSGAVGDPLRLRRLDIDVRLSGENPQRLYSVLGIPFPALPPYRANGHLDRQGTRWVVTELDGHVGDSDIHGRFALDTAGEKPTIEADLFSRVVDFDDLGTVIGTAPATGPGETVSPEQERQAKQRAQRPTVLPDRDIDLRQVNAVDADVRWRAQRVLAPNLPFDDISLTFRLRNGRLIFDPLEFGVGGGTVRADVVLDARDKPVEGQIEAEIASVDLGEVLAPVEIADESVGRIAGRTKLWVKGNSVAEMLASADGGLLLLMDGGRLDSLLVELAGLDAGEALLILVGGRQPVPVNCAFLDIHARNGVFTLDTGVIDSTDTRFLLLGSVDMRGERLDLTIHPHPKDVSVLAARSPLHIEGRLKQPDLDPDASALLGRGAAAAVLAAIAGPLAGLLPLLETGPGESGGTCSALSKVDLVGEGGE